MHPVVSVFDVAKKALGKNPKYVTIDWDKVDSLRKTMEKDGRPVPFVSQQSNIDKRLFILKELIACSINYCYWYGVSDLRPNDGSSTLMYKLVDDAFCVSEIENDLVDKECFDDRIDVLIKLLAINRFPLLEDRVRHLKQLELYKAGRIIDEVILNDSDVVVSMIKLFPGLASDIFLKRVSLFFIQLNRKYGWFAEHDNDLMFRLPVPADYQLPKILNHLGCIKYKPSLEEDIWEGKLIEKHSLAEIQIRAATIQICDNLMLGLDGWTIGDVDTWIWTKRKLTDMPFHCTITTDY